MATKKSKKSKIAKKQPDAEFCGYSNGQEFYDKAIRPVSAEFIGTTIFVFVSVLSIFAADNLTIATAQGLTIAFVAATFGPLSGGHVNPAVTLTAVIIGQLSIVKGIVYFVFQVLGGIAGAALARVMFDSLNYDIINGGVASLGTETSLLEGMATEGVLTFILTLTFALVTVASTPQAGSIVIGLSILVGVSFGLDKTGGAINPARAIGPAIIRSFDTGAHWAEHWIYWVGPILGAVLSAILFRFLLADPSHRAVCKGEEDEEEEDFLEKTN